MSTLLKAKKYVPHYERGGKFNDKTKYLPVVISDSEINKLKVKDNLGLSLNNHIINVMPAYNTNVNSADMFLSVGKHGYVIEQVSRTQFRLFNAPSWGIGLSIPDDILYDSWINRYNKSHIHSSLLGNFDTFIQAIQNIPKP